MPGRKKRIPNVYNLHVPLEVACHASVAQALVTSVMKHLAFSRDQCHAPYQQLETHAQACQQQQQQQLQQLGRQKRLPSAARKAIKYYDQLSTLIRLAQSIPYHQLRGQAVVLLLGSSVQRPREVYCMHFPAAMHHPGEVQPPPAAAVSAASRKLLRHIIMEHSNIPELDEPPGPTKMWLLFQAPGGVLQCAPEGFAIRRAFSINLRKAFQVNLLTGGETPDSSRLPGLHPLPQLQQQLPQLGPLHKPTAVAAAAAAAEAAPGGVHSMEVDTLSQQLSLHMSLTDAGSREATCEWFQATLHVKGLKALSSNH